MDDGRVSFVGEIKKVPEGEETTKARETYLARHPGHFWVDFGELKKNEGGNFLLNQHFYRALITALYAY